jgi:hypothetical protein
MVCGIGSVATLHPAELFGEDWMSFSKNSHLPPPTTLVETALIEPATKA